MGGTVLQQVRKYSYFVLLGLCFAFAFFVRTKLYLSNNVFSDDECRLALSMMNKGFLRSLVYLGQAQSAPPVFILVSKLMTALLGFTEHAAKFLPYAAGVGSIYMFYKVSSSYLQSRIAIVIANFIFAICQPLVSFSSIFKQYSLDVLMGLLCLYYLPKIRIEELSMKQLCILLVTLVTLPLISLPSLFFIAAFFVNNVIKNWKRILILLVPFIIFMGIYYIFSLAPAKLDLNNYFPDYWTDGFWGISLSEFLKLLIVNIKFYFVPNDLSLAAIILLFWGIYLYIKEKNKFILSTFFFILLAAFLKLYPLSGRVGLFALPIFLLFILKPFDIKKKAALVFASLLVFLSFCRYDVGYLKNIMTDNYMVSYSPKTLMMIMKDKFNPKTDTVLCNSASTPSYLFYSEQNNFYPENVYEMPLNHLDKTVSMKYLNNLEHGRNYWIYLIKDYRRAEVFPIVFEWLEVQNVKYKKHEKNSYLFYVER